MKKKRNAFLIILIVIFSLALIGSAVFLILKAINENAENSSLSSLASSYASGIESSAAASDDGSDSGNGSSSGSGAEAVDSPVDFDSLTQQNPDVYSWIYIPGTNVNYPVLQSNTDDNYYLDHDIDKNYSYSGSIYSQVCNKKDYSDRVTVLYGHNMANGSMFATLHNFYDSDFFDQNKYIYIYTESRKLTYEIVSSFEYDNRHIMNSFDFSDDEVFSDYLEMIQNPRSVSVNKRDVELTTDDKILVLSTCVNSGDGRYLVQGVLKKDEPTK